MLLKVVVEELRCFDAEVDEASGDWNETTKPFEDGLERRANPAVKAKVAAVESFEKRIVCAVSA